MLAHHLIIKKQSKAKQNQTKQNKTVSVSMTWFLKLSFYLFCMHPRTTEEKLKKQINKQRKQNKNKMQYLSLFGRRNKTKGSRVRTRKRASYLVDGDIISKKCMADPHHYKSLKMVIRFFYVLFNTLKNRHCFWWCALFRTNTSGNLPWGIWHAVNHTKSRLFQIIVLSGFLTLT